MNWPLEAGDWDGRIKLGLKEDDAWQKRKQLSGGDELFSSELSVK